MLEFERNAGRAAERTSGEASMAKRISAAWRLGKSAPSMILAVAVLNAFALGCSDIAQPTGMAVSLETGEAASPTSNAIFLIGNLRD